jgi:hypothetical protein
VEATSKVSNGKVYPSERPLVSRAAATYVFFGGKIPSTPLMRPESLMTLSKKEGIALIEGCHPVKIKKSLLT